MSKTGTWFFPVSGKEIWLLFIFYCNPFQQNLLLFFKRDCLKVVLDPCQMVVQTFEPSFSVEVHEGQIFKVNRFWGLFCRLKMQYMRLKNIYDI